MIPSDALAQRQGFYSCLAGTIFAAGWWCLIDGYNMGTTVVNDPASNASAGFAWLPPFLASLFYLCINAMTWKELDERFVQQPSTAKKARVFLLCILFVAMCAVVGAAYIMVDKFLRVPSSYQWAGISTLVSTLLIVLSAFVQRFATLPPSA